MNKSTTGQRGATAELYPVTEPVPYCPIGDTHTVRSGDGLRLHVREWGNPAGPPILFIHGWSQNHLCWTKQVGSPLAQEFRLVALDIRGHGMSDKPLEAEHYTDPQRWADDIAAVIKALRLDRPVLVAWSYGGFIICDYLRAYGQAAIRGINFVGGAVTLGERAIGTFIGPGFFEPFPGATAADLPTNIAAIRGFLRGIFHTQPSQDDFEVALCCNIVVPTQVRAALAQRQIDSDDVLSTLELPVLVTHGRHDNVVLPAMASHILSTGPTTEPSWYEDAGHAPFMEDPGRFNAELAAFVRFAATS
jgi:non-heme chloroperoxidase